MSSWRISLLPSITDRYFSSFAMMILRSYHIVEDMRCSTTASLCAENEEYMLVEAVIFSLSAKAMIWAGWVILLAEVLLCSASVFGNCPQMKGEGNKCMPSLMVSPATNLFKELKSINSVIMDL